MAEAHGNGATPLKNAEINVFVKTSEGFKAHIKVAEIDYLKAPGVLQQLSISLKDKNFTPDAGPSPNGGGGGGRQSAANPNPRSAAAPNCPDCDGGVWDNRNNKRNPKAPDFRCKDKECAAAGWIQNDGGIKWSNPL